MPFVDGGVELHSRIGAGPGGIADLFPQLAGADPFGHLAVGAADKFPFAVVQHFLQERVGQAYAVVGILPGYGHVGFRIPVGVVFGEGNLGVSLAGELDHPLDIILRDHGFTGANDRRSEGRVLFGVQAVFPGHVFLVAGFHDLAHVQAGQARPGDQRRHLLLLAHFPVDELADVRMVDVDDHHLGGAPGRAAGLDGPGGTVADAQETHQAR